MTATGESMTGEGAVGDVEEQRRSRRSLVRYARPDLEHMAGDIAADRAAGATLGELAARYNVSIWAVRQVLNAAGLSGRSRSSEAPGVRPGLRVPRSSSSDVAAPPSASSTSATAAASATSAAPSPAAPTAAPPVEGAISGPAHEPAPARATASAAGVAPTASAPVAPAVGLAADDLMLGGAAPVSAAGRRADRSTPTRQPIAEDGWPVDGGPLSPDAAPARRQRLTEAQIRRLRAVRALHSRSPHDAEHVPVRLAELVAQLWTEGADLTDLADALEMTADALTAFLRRSGVSAA